MVFNIGDHDALMNNGGASLKLNDDFKYLGAGKRHKSGKALAWTALRDMKKSWRSNVSKMLKVRHFQAAIDTILLNVSETRTLSSTD